jgi:hypothetical protein
MPYPWDPAVTFGQGDIRAANDFIIVGPTDPGAVGPGKVWVDTTNQVVYYRNPGNTAWVSTASAGGPPTGAAGGDLAGSYPNPTVKQATFDGKTKLSSASGVTPLDATGSGFAEILEVIGDTGHDAELRMSVHGGATGLSLRTPSSALYMGDGTNPVDVGAVRLAVNKLGITAPAGGEAELNVQGFLTFGNPSDAGIYEGSADPTAGGGVTAVEGSIYLRNNGSAYIKTGVAATAWTLLSTGSGSSSIKLPTLVQRNAFNTNSQNPTCVLGSAPAAGDALVMVLNLAGRASTGVTQTNVTWTQLLTVTSGGGNHYELWVGIAAAAASATINITTGSSNYWTVTVIEVPDVLTPTLGINATGAAALHNVAGDQLLDAPSGITPGHLVAAFVGADNTTTCHSISTSVPSIQEMGQEKGNGFAGALALYYAPTGSHQVNTGDGTWSSVGEYIFAELT